MVIFVEKLIKIIFSFFDSASCCRGGNAEHRADFSACQMFSH